MTNQILWAIVSQTAIIVVGALSVLLYNKARFDALDKRIDDLMRRVERIEQHIFLVGKPQ
jgi:hypothetical protein